MTQPFPPPATRKRPARPRSSWALPALLALAALLVVPACSAPTDRAADLPHTPPLVGAFIPSGVWNDLGPFKALEQRLGGEFVLAHWYASWDTPYDPVPVDDVLEHGRIPLVTWQAHTQTLPDIVAGRHDAYIAAWARGVRGAAGVVYVRIFPEMNGDWTPWSGDPATLRAAWRHVVDLFRREGATNVRWVFTPNVTDEPRTAANAMELYYPGHDYVDVLGLDGYNWGDVKPYIGWRSFEQVFAEGYRRISRVGPQAVWLAEIASAESGGDKADWIEDMLRSTAFPRVEALVWFNEDKETDWRIESSTDSLEAFRNYFEAAGARRGLSAASLASTAPARSNIAGR